MTEHYKQSIAKSNRNPLLEFPAMLLGMATQEKHRSARYIVARNLRRLMEESATLNTQAKVGQKAGVKQRTVGYLLDPETTQMKSPKLETVEKVARAFGLEPWILLADPEHLGKELSDLLRRPVASGARLRELGPQPPTETLPPVRGKKGAKRRSFS